MNHHMRTPEALRNKSGQYQHSDWRKNSDQWKAFLQDTYAQSQRSFEQRGKQDWGLVFDSLNFLNISIVLCVCVCVCVCKTSTENCVELYCPCLWNYHQFWQVI